MAVTDPIHIATIRGQQLRFFRTPRNDGRPDMPWHCVEDLQRCLGLNREGRRVAMKIWRQTEFPIKTIATADGLVSIAPHFCAQGFISAIAELAGNADDVDREYALAGVEALQTLTRGLHGDDLLTWMAAAYHRQDEHDGDAT